MEKKSHFSRAQFSLQNFAKWAALTLMKYGAFSGYFCDELHCVCDWRIFLLSFSWTGVCSNHHYHCGYNCYGGSDHLLVEPLQTLDALLYQPSEPKQKTGGYFADSEYPLCYLIPSHAVLICIRGCREALIHVTVLKISTVSVFPIVSCIYQWKK